MDRVSDDKHSTIREAAAGSEGSPVTEKGAGPAAEQGAKRDPHYPIILSDTASQRATSFLRGYKQFWPFLKPYWWLGAIGIALTIPVGALDAVIAWFLKPFMDQVMIAQQQSFADYVPLVIIGFTLVQGVFIYLSSLVNGYVGGKINLLIRTRLYDKLLSFETRFYDANNSGSVIFRFYNDAEQASTGLISNIRLFLTKFFSSVSLVCVLLYNSWELSLVALGVLVFLVIPLRIVRRRIKKIISRTVTGSTSIITLYNETTQGSRVIKAYNLKEQMRSLFRDRAEFLFNTAIKLVRDTNWLSPVMHFVSAIGVAGVLYYGVHLILSGTITSGSFVSFLDLSEEVCSCRGKAVNDFVCLLRWDDDCHAHTHVEGVEHIVSVYVSLFLDQPEYLRCPDAGEPDRGLQSLRKGPRDVFIEASSCYVADGVDMRVLKKTENRLYIDSCRFKQGLPERPSVREHSRVKYLRVGVYGEYFSDKGVCV